MKLWIDDLREAPEGYVWLKTTNEAITFIKNYCKFFNHTWPLMKEAHTFPQIEVISIDHDAGEYYKYGGDYIKILDYLESNYLNFPIHIHSQNVVGVENMKRIIERNGWKEIR